MPSLPLAKRIAVISALLSATVALEAQTSGQSMPPSASSASLAPLTLEECIARAMQKNFDLKIQGYSTEQSREALTIAEAEYVPTFTAAAEKSGYQTYLSDQNQNYGETRVGVTQKLTTGATVNLSSSVNRTKYSPISTSGTINPAYDADMSLSVSQPLLKGAGLAVNRATIERAKIGVNRAGLDFQNQVLSVVRNVEAAYYNLCFAREQLNVRNGSLHLAETLFDEANVRRQAGVSTELDVLQAEVGVANARKNVISAEQAVHDNEDTLMTLIGQFELGAPIGDVSFPAYVNQAPSFDVSYKLAHDRHPELLSTQAAIKQYELDRTTAKNGKLPTLNLDGAVGYNTEEKSFSRSLNELPGSDGYTWQVGLSVSVPWGLKAERARYRSATSVLHQAEAQLQQQEQSLMAQVRAAVRAVDTNTESVAIAAKATELATRQYELEKAKFSLGTSTARRVLEAQDDLENARVSELQAQVDLRSAVSDLRRLEGSSIEKYSIALP